jgi:CubicO group peptidase (beta-lactamase class C family)
MQGTCLLLFCLCTLIAATSEIKLDICTELESKLQPLVDTLADKWHTGFQLGLRSPECALSIAAGYSDPFTKRRVATDDPFLLGSVTKTITATAVLQLVEQGHIGLNDSITKYVDPFLARTNHTTLHALWDNPLIHLVTVRHLLSMQSGLKVSSPHL